MPPVKIVEPTKGPVHVEPSELSVAFRPSSTFHGPWSDHGKTPRCSTPSAQARVRPREKPAASRQHIGAYTNRQERGNPHHHFSSEHAPGHEAFKPPCAARPGRMSPTNRRPRPSAADDGHHPRAIFSMPMPLVAETSQMMVSPPYFFGHESLLLHCNWPLTRTRFAPGRSILLIGDHELHLGGAGRG